MTTTPHNATMSNPAIARTMKEGASFEQQSAIISIARSKGLNGHRVCQEIHKCELHEITSLAASQLIDALKSGKAGTATTGHQPEAFAGETCCSYWASRQMTCPRSEVGGQIFQMMR